MIYKREFSIEKPNQYEASSSAELALNAGDKGAEQTRARNAIFKSPAHLIHFLNNYMLK
jgi:hypothetical protein